MRPLVDPKASTCLGLGVVAAPNSLQLAGTVVGWAGGTPPHLSAVPVDQRCREKGGSEPCAGWSQLLHQHPQNVHSYHKRRDGAQMLTPNHEHGGHHGSTSTPHPCVMCQPEQQLGLQLEKGGWGVSGCHPIEEGASKHSAQEGEHPLGDKRDWGRS